MNTKSSVIVLLLVAVGCGFAQSRMQAQKVWKDYFSAFQAESYDDALSLYNKAFFEQTSREQWGQTLESIRKKMGFPKEQKQLRWGVKKKVGLVGSGSYVRLVSEVTYEKGKTRETVTVFLPSSGGRATILRHVIRPAES